MQSRPKVVFFHIPKTGGMTFREVLVRIYRDQFHVCERPEVESIRSDFERHDCIEFHTIGFEGDFIQPHRDLVKQDRWDVVAGAEMFVMFREPVNQLVSQYYDAIRKREFVEFSYVRNGVKWAESLEEYVGLEHQLNGQLSFMAGEYLMASKRSLTRDDLARAKDFLVSHKVKVGLLERYAESLRIFEAATGREIPERSVEVRNQNESRPALDEVPQSLRDRIAEASVLDIELYEFAKGLFEEQLAACDPSLAYSFR